MSYHDDYDPFDPEQVKAKLEEREQSDDKSDGKKAFEYEKNLYTPELPEACRIDEKIGEGACPWLDEYIAYSLKWSPRGFWGFHESVGLWVLSAVAARRVITNLGGERHTGLYINLLGRTSISAKTETARLGVDLIDRCGLSWLLAPDNATPQRFIANLSGRLNEDAYLQADDERKAFLRLKVGMAGQRGWFYDEFGTHLDAMTREGGFMAEFRGHLRAMDNDLPKYEYETMTREDSIERPYLAILGTLTPSDLKRHARKGSVLWSDGLLARFMFSTAPVGYVNRGRFPKGVRVVPASLIKELVDWHKRLKVPQVEVTTIEKNVKGKSEPKVSLVITVNPVESTYLTLDDDVYDAYYAYDDGLATLASQSQNHDLDGNFTRLSLKALRVAMLLASVSGYDRVTMHHWAKAQSIAERWRFGLHEAYYQINANLDDDDPLIEKIMKRLELVGKAQTATELKRFVAQSQPIKVVEQCCLKMVESSLLVIVEKTRKGTNRYAISTEE